MTEQLVIPEGYSKVGDAVGEQTEDVGAQISDMNFKGYIPMWDTVTGEFSPCLAYLKWQNERKRRADGSPVFTFTDPHISRPQGNIMCLLHPGNPEAEKYLALGFTSCNAESNKPKAHMNTLDTRDRHMKASHKRFWNYLEEEKRQRERQEDRDMQNATMGALQALAKAQTPQTEEVVRVPYVKDADKE